MPIVFDQVDGVVQRAEDGPAPAPDEAPSQGAGGGAPDVTELQRQLELAHHRLQRLMAD